MIDAEIQRAIELHASGKPAEAATVVQAVLRRDPASVEARCVLATIALRNGTAAAAGPWLRQACALQPSYAPVHYYLALYRLERGDVPGMRASQARALDLLDSGSQIAVSLKAFASAWQWMEADTKTSLPSPARLRPKPPRSRKSWLFVWRDVGEFLQHFDLAGVGTRHTFLLPERTAKSTGNDPTARLTSLFEETWPDIVVFLPGTGRHLNPRLDAFQHFRRLGVPTVLFIPDMRKVFWQGIVDTVAHAFDLVIALDGCSANSLSHLRPLGDRFFRGWSPISPCTTPPLVGRPKVVNLVGSLWGERIAGIEALRRAGIDVITRPKVASGPQDPGVAAHKTLSTAAYLESIQRARLTVNFSACSTGDGHQLKGRIFEAAACGSMILESANEVTPDYFEEGREYIAFRSIADLVDKARYYLDHPEETQEIAARATRHFLTQYSASHFWRNVMSRAYMNNLRGTPTLDPT